MIEPAQTIALHQEAMEFAQQAMAARDQGRAQKLFRSAFEKEREAAEALAGELRQEPTRAILFRSAATLALDCGDLAEAERLARKGLAGEPPEEQRRELEEILARSNRPKGRRTWYTVLSYPLAAVFRAATQLLLEIRAHHR